MLKTTLTLTALLASASAFAQALPGDTPVDEADPIIVTGTRALDGTPADLLGSSYTLLDAQALENRQTRVVSDILRDVPGVAVSRSGGVGGFTQVRLRGTEANHTLVLIDGIEASDPFLGEFDFATLIADDVARIEVLRGQQSATYGSDAIGGVIHYITANGADAPGVRGRIEGGSFGTVSGAARIGGVASGLDYVLSGAFLDTDGTPSARRGIGDRDLSAGNRQLAGKLAYDLAPNLRLFATGRYARVQADTNPQDFDFTSPTYGFVVDGSDSTTSRSFLGLARAELDLMDGAWTQAATVQLNDTHRNSRTDGDLTSDNRGERFKAAYDSTYRLVAGTLTHAFTVAADFERERFRSVAVFAPSPANLGRSTDNTGIVGEYDLRVGDKAGFGASIRRDLNNRFEDATTWRVRGSYALSPLVRVRAAAGSGIKNPTNYELFGFDPRSFIGNPNLKPEKSEGIEGGVDLTPAAGVRLGATLFRSVLRDEIYSTFSPSFVVSPANRTTRSRQRGVELFAHAPLGYGFVADLAYTYLDAIEAGREEVRRPPHIGSANLTWAAAGDAFGATLTARYNGKSFDSNFTNLPLGPRVRLDDYTLVNLAADARITGNLRAFARVENLFAAKYEDVFTYRTPGRAAYAGIRAGF
ncbi:MULTISPECIES: TonB-dependent receptor plug domain-containing protein [unclassified Sphingomonas]|uniref:TonB-dependent receptor plug domain-containing protein n=1 Tax=unclassified Sphingomonas TaxID=196159 RepID=UPI001F3058AB|nr:MULTISPECIES: TonB-dependent receptor [unclassified Sphingomonas]